MGCIEFWISLNYMEKLHSPEPPPPPNETGNRNKYINETKILDTYDMELESIAMWTYIFICILHCKFKGEYNGVLKTP